MSLFEPMREFSHRRAVKNLNATAACVYLANRREEFHLGNFVFPGTDYLDDVEIGGQRVGHVAYGINPLSDRLYINMLEIELAQRGQGIGVAVLWRLWRTHGVPIVPISQYGTSGGFWSLARRRFAAAGALIEPELRLCDLDDAKQRWQHLVPEAEDKRLIREYWEWVAAEHAAGRSAGPGIR